MKGQFKILNMNIFFSVVFLQDNCNGNYMFFKEWIKSLIRHNFIAIFISIFNYGKRSHLIMIKKTNFGTKKPIKVSYHNNMLFLTVFIDQTSINNHEISNLWRRGTFFCSFIRIEFFFNPKPLVVIVNWLSRSGLKSQKNFMLPNLLFVLNHKNGISFKQNK